MAGSDGRPAAHGLSGPPRQRLGRTIHVSRTDEARQVPAFEEFRWVMGNGLITSDGDPCRRDRRIVAPRFTRRRVA